MARKKVKPDLNSENIGINPFASNLTIYTTKKEHKVLNKFGNEDIKEFELEAIPYTKVFEVEGAKKQIHELPIRSKELYLYLIHAIKSAQDYIWIDKVAYMKQMGIKSINTYKDAVFGLTDNVYISEHSRFKDVFWINPHYFFKGSRINKYPKSVVLKSKIKVK